MSGPTNERLARALEQIGELELAERARRKEFSDYETPHATPKVLLVEALVARGQREFAKRVVAGEFDDTKAEAQEWWQREGRFLIHGGAARGV